MSVWRDVIDQPRLVEALQRAATDPASMTHAWLFTGPPGSGRSTAARAFAAALECPQHGCGECRECRTVLEGSHADLEVVATEGLSIGVDRARELALEAQMSPAVGPWRIVLIEDVDRLTERAADALLKAIEEPAPRTVWLLCAPSPEDVIVTIRSRSRHMRLRTPSAQAVAQLLERRDGIPHEQALSAAFAAQSHVGLARRLARDDAARSRRADAVGLAGSLRSLGDAMDAAAKLSELATSESEAMSAERDAAEKEKLLTQLGADAQARTQPPYVRAQLAALAKEQATRAKRVARDVVDRSLIDLMSVFRDALVVQAGADVDLVNQDRRDQVQHLADAWSAQQLVEAMDAIGTARERIDANVPLLLALEAMMISLRTPADAR